MLDLKDLQEIVQSFQKKVLPFLDKRTKESKKTPDLVFDDTNLEIKIILKDVLFQTRVKDPEKKAVECLNEAINEFYMQNTTKYSGIDKKQEEF